MPRTARKKSKSGIYHIVLRGINRQTVFEEEEDTTKFLQTLADYKEKSGYKIYAYCLMGNHIHLLLKEEKEELGVIMRRIGASYVYWYNWKYKRCGHLFQDRYKSEAVEDERYFLTVVRYIHQNPLKAGIVKDVGAYKWSSFWEFASTTGDSYIGWQKHQLQKPSPVIDIEKNKIIDIDFVLGLFSKDRKKAIDAFKAFHEISNNDNCLDIEENRRITDDEAIEIIKKICNVSYCTEVQTLENDKKNRCLKVLKEEGLSTRQIARLTGISRGIILKT